LISTSGQSCIGIRANLSAASGARGYLFLNNHVSNILSIGASTPISVNNPTGILIDATTANTAANVVTLVNNTINMSGTNILSSNSGITALYLGNNIRGGISSVNNIFGVTANRVTSGNMYAVNVLSPTSPFAPNASLFIPASDFNSYFVSGNNPNLANNILMATPGATLTTRTNINAIRTFMGANIDLSSFSFPTRFILDTLPDLLAVSAGSRYTTGASVSIILSDIYGSLKGAGSNLGAVNFLATNAALQPSAIYQINGVDSFPVLASPSKGSFRTLRSAVNYLNAFGVGFSFSGVNPVRLELSNGYVGETDTFISPITVLDYPFANIAVPVVVSVAPNRQDTIRFTNVLTPPALHSSLIRITSGRFFGFDGSNNKTNSRDLTIMMPSIMTSNTYKIIDLLGGQNSIFSVSLATSNNSVINCNLIGNSTVFGINTFAAIYSGGITATPSNSIGTGLNNGNVFSNNFIGGCQYGIYLRGNGIRGQGDANNVISDNVIGGDIAPGGSVSTNYFGGINNAAGIFCVGQYTANISRNKIQNNIVTFSNPRGIELATIAGNNTVLDSANTIEGNIIKSISSTVASSTAYGLYMNFGADAGNITNSSVIKNNMISGIAAPGTTTLMGGVYGIAIDGTANITDPNIGIYFNSINLGTANTLASNTRSACLAIATPFRLDASSIANNYGFKLTNNIFSNKLGGAPATTNVTARAVIIGNINSPFNFSDNNNFFTNASNANTGLVMGNAGAAAPVTYTTWDSIYNFTGGDLFSSNLSAPFTSDLDLFIPASSNTVIKTVGVPVTGILIDAIGTTRNTFVPTIGAHEYSGGLYVDSVLPRILPANAVSCVSSLFNTVTFIVVDKNYTGNVFTYRVNGGTQINLPLSASVIGTNLAGYRTITYTLPVNVLNAGGLIEFKITATDVAGNIGVYPSDKPWAVLATGLSTFPYTMNFENGNADWSNQSLTGGANWNLGAFGSASSPSQPTESGIRCALFPSSTLPAGASARLVSPCLNLSVLNRPILRFRFSQSNNLVNKRDSITVKMMVNGFLGSEVKVAVRPNASSPFPDWFTYEVCLTEYRTPGNTYNVVFDAFSTGGGQNMMIDSIQILDDVQNQVVTPQNATICNTSQPFSVTIPNSDSRYVYRALHLENGGGVSILDTAIGNSGNLVLNFANRQVDTINYVISAINYGSGTYVAPFSVNPSNFCSNNLPGTFRTVINRFTRPLTNAGGYIIPDLTVGAFNGAANDGDQFKPDAVKFGNKLTYKILTPTSYYTTASYNTAWTLLNTTLRTVNSGTPATNFTFTAPTASADAKVEFTPTAAEGDSVFILSSTLRFLGTNCDTIVTRYIKVNNPVAYNFVTGPRADTACTGTGLNFLINQGSLAGTTQLWNFDDGTISSFSTPSKTWATPGVYRVRLTVTSALGISDTVSRLIYVLQAPSASYTASSVAIVCQNDSTFFNVSNPAPGLTYLWNFPGNITRTTANATFGFSKADTNYAVSLRVTNPANACFAINNRIFPSYAKPKAKFTVTSHCQGLNMPYTDSSSISNGDRLGWNWTFSTGETRLSNSFQIKFANSGNVRVSLRLTSAAGCVDTTSQIVTVYETPKAGFTYTAACTNDSTTFTNQTVYGAGIQNANYVWDFGDNSGTDNRQDPKHRYLNNNSGDPFFVKLIASNKLFGCKDSSTQGVIVNTAPVAVAELGGTVKTGISTDKVCVGNTVTFTSKSFSSNGAEVTCDWVFGNGQSGACNSFNVYPDPGVYNWSITAKSNGCVDTKSGSITVVPKPVITYTKQHFAIPPSIYTTNNRKVFTPSDLVADKNTYSWNFGDVDSTTSNQRVAEFTYNKKGTYTVRMKVTTADGCVVTFTDTTKVDVGVSVGEEIAAKFDLVAYPNPLTNNAFVSLSLNKSENISIVITDVLGREISSTNYDKVSAGKHNFELTSNNFTAAGAYFVKVIIGDETVVKSLVKQ
ncbi:MAG: PKD domain-containing protein, partial [Bacteroidia bacterium]|nr:PKD domain-containing protein [Bacteroidia bacterium]